MSFFVNNDISDDEKRNLAFHAVNAVRESVTIAQNLPQPITYQETMDLIAELNPDLYQQFEKLLCNKYESDIARYFKDKAKVLSDSSKAKVTPQQLIQEEIQELERYVAQDPKTKSFKRRIKLLQVTLEYFTPRIVSEHKVLMHDLHLANRGDIKKVYLNESSIDYALSGSRTLRMHLLHPDNEEHILGCDMIYEQFDLKNERVRFVHLQYKTWGKDERIYFSQGNTLDQLNKMESNLCNSGFCHKGNNINEKNFRFPFCSAFLRPTSPILQNDSKLISTGIHIPVCEVLKIKENFKSLTKKNTKDTKVSQLIFEELFNNYLLGSRWLKISELEEFYEKRGITNISNMIRVHAQEFK
ncbi:MAG: hypothetical protein MUF42_15855 [Cytophagaceae bacterium]|jgi:hypothetical protein|nr:hypothetical protein [Cytophagaceae bacterium]